MYRKFKSLENYPSVQIVPCNSRTNCRDLNPSISDMLLDLEIESSGHCHLALYLALIVFFIIVIFLLLSQSAFQ